MIVELYGLPASGKTILAQELRTNGNFKIVKIRSNIDLIVLNIYFFICHIRLSFVTIQYLFLQRSSLRLLYYKFMNTYLHHNAKYIKASKILKAVVDEGLWQNCISLFDKPVSTDVLREYIKLLPLPDELIIFDLDRKLWQQHINSRGIIDRAVVINIDRQQWLDTVYNNHQIFLQVIKEEGIRCRYIRSYKELNKCINELVGHE